MIIRQVYGVKAKFCNEGCKEGFKTDRQHGLIYPQYEVEGQRMSVEDASIKAGFCAYCNQYS